MNYKIFKIETILLLLPLHLSICNNENKFEIDPNGYIVYCPCMGRFGNQAEQFLGTFQFAKHLNRTLILPPFIEYVKYKINFVPFKKYFEIKHLITYHKVMTMDQFMSSIANTVWKIEDRSIACYSSRTFSDEKTKNDCNPFEGSPFKEFWYHLNVTSFNRGSIFYGPIQTDYSYANDWKAKYGHVPVLTFVGAPSSFPTNSKAVQLQQFVHFTETISDDTKRYREERGFARRPYLSIHIRHGSDWSRACDLLRDENHGMTQLFSSQQCLGSWVNKKDNQPPIISSIRYDLCMPHEDQIVDSIEHALSRYDDRHPNQPPIEDIHIATDMDNQTLWSQLHRRLSRSMVTLHTSRMTYYGDGRQVRHDNDPHYMVDLYLMSYANVFIGNCISSFSGFASRYRMYNLHLESETHFFAFESPSNHVHRWSHDEL